jgi:hypothetical protein
MVRAILEGKKTQTRRIVKPQPSDKALLPREWGKVFLRRDHPDIYGSDGTRCGNVPLADSSWGEICCPYGQPGDLLWVRETWQVVAVHEETESWEMPHIRWSEITDWPKKIPKCLPASYSLRYAANKWTEDEREAMDKPYPWRSPIFMPRWASRITLEITGVRVERLQQISDADALAEGCSTADMRNGDSLASVYTRLWESIHGPGSWDANPWVWVVEFRKLTTTTEP